MFRHKEFGVQIWQELRRGSHHSEIAEKVSALVMYASSVKVKAKSDSQVTIILGAPYSAMSSQVWSEETARKINLIDQAVVRAEVVKI